MATLLLSQGVPMILGGDELSKTQGGNNNSYCQDNELNWYDWRLGEAEADFLEFVREIIAFRRKHPTFRRRHFVTGVEDEEGGKDVSWWGPEGREMSSEDWGAQGLQSLAMLLDSVGPGLIDRDAAGDAPALIVLNGGGTILFHLPPPPAGGRWKIAFATEPETTRLRNGVLELGGQCVTVLQPYSHGSPARGWAEG
jgi:isoamylase